MLKFRGCHNHFYLKFFFWSKCDYIYIFGLQPLLKKIELFFKIIAKKAGITIFIYFYHPTYPIAI
jgi:hypothetical protein